MVQDIQCGTDEIELDLELIRVLDTGIVEELILMVVDQCRVEECLIHLLACLQARRLLVHIMMMVGINEFHSQWNIDDIPASSSKRGGCRFIYLSTAWYSYRS